MSKERFSKLRQKIDTINKAVVYNLDYKNCEKISGKCPPFQFSKSCGFSFLIRLFLKMLYFKKIIISPSIGIIDKIYF